MTVCLYIRDKNGEANNELSEAKNIQVTYKHGRRELLPSMDRKTLPHKKQEHSRLVCLLNYINLSISLMTTNQSKKHKENKKRKRKTDRNICFLLQQKAMQNNNNLIF